MDNLFLDRRRWLHQAGMGLGMLGVGSLLEAEAASDQGRHRVELPHHPPKAKHVIHIFFNGGLSQMDSFDPKPMLARYHGKTLPARSPETENMTGGAFASPFKFKPYGQSGIEVSELFPHIGQVVDKMCVIRSMHTDSVTHTPSLMMMNSGTLTQTTPAMGSWVTYGLGTENRSLPGFVVLCPGGLPIAGPNNWRSAFLPSVYQGTLVDTDNTDVERLIADIRNRKIGTAQQRRQLDLLQQLNLEHRQRTGADDAIDARIESYELAYRMQASASDAFDIGKEPAHIREMYGDSAQGRQLLIARRLVERGVRFVQCWHGKNQPWDNHSELEKEHRFRANECDRGIGALIADLDQRGLLDETIVFFCGEFGRTPTAELSEQGKSLLGRDHNPYAFTCCVAGGGFRRGEVYGKSDPFGYQAIENRVHVHDLHATILHQLGIDHKRFTYRHAGRDFRLTDVDGHVVQGVLA
ncbi:MAG: DUF1501 domain-containing protein [Pirellulales bacterium]|nr:DUF1501 domain-containing protein [Pirellulales bacterium]